MSYWPRTPGLSNLERFLEKTKRADSGCLEWLACRNTKGYGWFRFDGRNQVAHRVAWMLEHGDIPEGLCICHTCDNRICVDVDHLFLGTVKDNNRDMFLKGRNANQNTKKNHCPQGHPYAGSNLYLRPGTTHRMCRACTRDATRKWRDRKRRPQLELFPCA